VVADHVGVHHAGQQPHLRRGSGQSAPRRAALPAWRPRAHAAHLVGGILLLRQAHALDVHLLERVRLAVAQALHLEAAAAGSGRSGARSAAAAAGRLSGEQSSQGGRPGRARVPGRRAGDTHTEPKLPLPRKRTTLNFWLSSPGWAEAPGRAAAPAGSMAAAALVQLGLAGEGGRLRQVGGRWAEEEEEVAAGPAAHRVVRCRVACARTATGLRQAPIAEKPVTKRISGGISHVRSAGPTPRRGAGAGGRAGVPRTYCASGPARRRLETGGALAFRAYMYALRSATA
jgi:hypothetical protein